MGFANNWVAKRVGQSVLTVFAVLTISFGLVKALPGGPAAYILAKLSMSADMSFEQAMAVTEKYISFQPDGPLWEQYFDYLSAILQGDFGISVYYGDPVAGILARTLPWTIFYASIALLLTYGLAVAFGALLAYYEGSKFDSVGSVVSISLNSVPYYAAALILVFIFGYWLRLFPTSGKVPTGIEAGLNTDFVAGALYHAALPILSIVVTAMGGLALAMRGNAISVMGEDYLRVARLRGVPENRIALRYVGRNAVLPMYTRLLIDLGFIFGGSIVLEMIFRYPAAGYYMYQAINTRDTPLMMGIFIMITIAVVFGIFVADLTYGLLDPRASGGADRETY
jgi:peptide/nickel transport system permease protein